MISELIDYLNHLFERTPAAILKIRWLVLLIFISSSAFMFYGAATRFNIDMSLETMFSADDPIRVTLNDFRQQFGSDDGVYIVYEAADGDVFSEKSIATIAKLHHELDDARVARDESATELTRIETIDSLYNVRLQKVEGDTLIAQKLLATDFPKNAEERESKRSTALDQDMFRLAYFSDNFRYGGIRIKTDFGTIVKGSKKKTESTQENLLSDDLAMDFTDDFANDMEFAGGLAFDESISEQRIEYETTHMDEYLLFMEALREITDKPEYAHFKFHYSGNAPMMEFATQTMKQGSGLITGMLVVFIFLLWYLFRSFSAVVWPVGVILVSVGWAIGAFSWLGITLSSLVMLTAMLVMAVGVATCVHVLSTYGIYRKEGQEHTQAIATAYRQTGWAIFLTSITTMAGMLALLTSDMPQISMFGLLSTTGVLIMYLMIMFVLPICLEYWRPYSDTDKNQKQRSWLQPILQKIPGFTERHAKPIVTIYLLAFAVLIYGTFNVKVDTNITESTKEGSEIREAARVIDSFMMGGQTMEVILNLDNHNAVKDPALLKAIEAFQAHILENYAQYIVKSFSISDYVKDTNKAMNEDRDEYRVIPDDPYLVAQLLYLFDNSNPEDRRSLVSDDYSRTHITIQLKNAGSYEYTDVFDALDQDIEHYFGSFLAQSDQASILTTGTLPMMMRLVDTMSWSQIKSFSVAAIIISLFLILAVSNINGGLLSVIPNILPAVSTFGLMGLLGISLDTDTLIVAPLIIGIAVDDTIHFMVHYRELWLKTGNVRESLKETIYEVGQAVSFTTVILATGFLVLVFSDFIGIAKIGAFGAFAIVIALSCDLLLIPAAIHLIKPDLGRKKYLARVQSKTQPA